MYQRTQPGTLIVVLLLGFLSFVVAMGFAEGWHPVVIIIGIVFLVLLVLFRSLTIEIDERELRCYFGVGLIRKRFLLKEIVSAKAIRNRWYYGWGVRLTPTGWMFNVSGLDAVLLTLRSGKQFRIGTDDPEEVLAQLSAFMNPDSAQA